jgi:hypothetical protein
MILGQEGMVCPFLTDTLPSTVPLSYAAERQSQKVLHSGTWKLCLYSVSSFELCPLSEQNKLIIQFYFRLKNYFHPGSQQKLNTIKKFFHKIIHNFLVCYKNKTGQFNHPVNFFS